MSRSHIFAYFKAGTDKLTKIITAKLTFTQPFSHLSLVPLRSRQVRSVSFGLLRNGTRLKVKFCQLF